MPEGPSRPGHAGHLLLSRTDLLLRTQTSPAQIRTMDSPQAPHPHHLPRPGIPRRRGGRHPFPRVPSDGRAGGGQGHHHVPISRACSNMFAQEALRAGDQGPLPPRPSSPSPSRASKWTCPAPSAAARAAGSARARAGSRSWAPAWCIPTCLAVCGIDPEVYSGFAFGIGLDRLTITKYKISDIRLLFENDLRFLEQF